MSTKPRYRWLRFSLRGFLLTVTIFTAIVGTWIISANKQRRAVEQLRQYPGVWVEYAHQEKAPRDLNDPYFSATHSWVPDFLYHAMGPDYFHKVVGVWLNPHQDKKLTAVRLCKELDYLQRLELYRYDDGDSPQLLDEVTKFRQLEELTLNVPADWLTADRIHGLVQLKCLKKLRLFVYHRQQPSLVTVAQGSEPFDLSFLTNFDRLEELSLGFATNAQWHFSDNFVGRNANLKNLTIECAELGDYASQHFGEIAKSCPNLVLLTIRIGPDAGSFAPLAQLKGLGMVNVEGSVYSVKYDEQVKQIQQELPNVVILDMSSSSRPRGLFMP